jgi:hypothetical protein
MCARTEWFLREFRRAMANRAAIFPTDHLVSGPPLFGTLSAHRPGHDIATHAIRRHRLTVGGRIATIHSGHIRVDNTRPIGSFYRELKGTNRSGFAVLGGGNGREQILLAVRA